MDKCCFCQVASQNAILVLHARPMYQQGSVRAGSDFSDYAAQTDAHVQNAILWVVQLICQPAQNIVESSTRKVNPLMYTVIETFSLSRINYMMSIWPDTALDKPDRGVVLHGHFSNIHCGYAMQYIERGYVIAHYNAASAHTCSLSRP